VRGLAAAITVAAIVCASACGDAPPVGPPELRLGVDVCDGCGMTIAETRCAAAAIADDGSERRMLKFDDIGCLARWEAAASGSSIRARWVHDRPTEAWIDASTAKYLQASELPTPMGSGIAAFKVASGADVLVAERGGETLSWDAILARARDGSLQRHPGSGQEVPQ
jgi:copper chaperone NosL